MKKFLSLLLSTIMTVSMCTVSSVSAYDTNTIDSQAQTQQQNSGDSVYGDFQYTVSDGKVTITNYTGSATAVSIPSKIEGKPVTNIGIFAFSGCSSLTSVTIPSSVKSMEYDVFGNCSSLTNINVDSNNANYSSTNGVLFNKNKTKLIRYPMGKTNTSYTISNNVTEIEDWAFYNCRSLTSINVDSNNANYSSTNGVLFNKNKIKLIRYPIGKTNISYTIPNSVTIIGYEAFSGCSSLMSVEIPSSVKSIENYVFDNCGSLTNINVDSKNADYSSTDGVLFNKNKNPDLHTAPNE